MYVYIIYVYIYIHIYIYRYTCIVRYIHGSYFMIIVSVKSIQIQCFLPTLYHLIQPPRLPSHMWQVPVMHQLSDNHLRLLRALSKNRPKRRLWTGYPLVNIQKTSKNYGTSPFLNGATHYFYGHKLPDGIFWSLFCVVQTPFGSPAQRPPACLPPDWHRPPGATIYRGPIMDQSWTSLWLCCGELHHTLCISPFRTQGCRP